MHNPLLLRKARDLKRRSRTLRDEGNYDGAEGLLREAIALLSEPVRSMVALLPADVPAPEDLRDLATELADCWGSLGGVRRRHADLLVQREEHEKAAAMFNAAVEAYDTGIQFEQDDRLRIANSYNLVQRAVVPILTSPQLLSDKVFNRKLREIQRSVERQIATSRPDDPWAYSDLGLVRLLAGEEQLANDAWEQMDKLAQTSNVYTSGLPVLESLAKILGEYAPLRRAVERFRAKIAGH